MLCYFALFVCLTLLASFFLPSHLSCNYIYSAQHEDAVFQSLDIFSVMVHAIETQDIPT